jgi:hypothetical protein
LARQARLRRLSETSNGGSEADGGLKIKYGYVLAELFSSPRHTEADDESGLGSDAGDLELMTAYLEAIDEADEADEADKADEADEADA